MISRSCALARTQQRHVHADKVGFAQSVFKRNILDPISFFRNTARVPQIHLFLNGFDVVVILVGRVVAQHVHIEAGAFLDHGQSDTSRADDRDRFPGDFVPQKRQVRMPVSPLVLARQMLGRPHLAGQHAQHEEGELRSGFGENVGRMGERNLIAIGVGAIDIVKSDGNLGHNFQRVLAGFEDLGINRIAQRGDQARQCRSSLYQ